MLSEYWQRRVFVEKIIRKYEILLKVHSRYLNEKGIFVYFEYKNVVYQNRN